MGYESLLSHYLQNQTQYWLKIFVIGLANTVQTQIFNVFLFGLAAKSGSMK